MKLRIKFLITIALLVVFNPASSKAQEQEQNNQQQSLEYNIENNLSGKNFRDYLAYDYGDLEKAKLQALQLSDSEIMYNIGCMYRDGFNVKRSYLQAKEWFSRSAEFGNNTSMVELAKIYSYPKAATGVNQDIEKAEDLLNKAIKGGDGIVYYKIGQMYERGIFFDKNPRKAIELYQQAAKKKYDKAYVKLYLAYQFGKGVRRSDNKAINWLRLIQKLGKDANIKQYATYLLSEKYYDMAVRLPANKMNEKFLLFNLSWENGKANAADMIAECYAKGYGVKRDCDMAKKWYEMSINQFESVTAMEQLGNMLVNADCGNYKRDYKKAAELFKRSADLGGSYGAYMMGYMTQTGMGIPKNINEADTWYKRSEVLKNRPKLNKIKRRKFTPEENV
ncbi:MAG TPA: hypothetical protein DIV86_01730 [Alphaproteobacteria bacterium]|nr:hypothetical protein [Alphaproteobacteria bacterium]